MSQFPTSTVRLQTLALLRDQIISSALMDGNSIDQFIVSSLLGSGSNTSGRAKSAAALTGRIRADAGMLRQASRNMGEASSIASIAKRGVGSIREALGAMQSLAEGVAAGTLSPAEAQTTYMDLAKSIEGVVTSTSYNGIRLLDQSAWAGDERLDHDAASGTASIGIQAGGESSPLTLRAIELGAFSEADLADASGAADTAARLSSLAGQMRTIENGYESMAARFASEEKSMTHQSAVLDSAAARAMEDPREEIKNMLLDFLLRNSGRIVDSSS